MHKINYIGKTYIPENELVLENLKSIYGTAQVKFSIHRNCLQAEIISPVDLFQLGADMMRIMYRPRKGSVIYISI